MHTVICFDLDGTLVQYDRSFDETLGDTFERELGTATDEMVAAYEEDFLAAFEPLDADPYHAGMAAALEAAGIEDVSVDRLVGTLRAEEFAATSVAPATRECLSELAADEETTLVCLTDGVGDWQREKLAHHDLADAFEDVVVSYDVGGHKAGGRPYDAVRERVDADEYVMVGDDYDADVKAARAAGFVPVHYEDADTDLFEILGAML
jgi:putative hydrolase of the HAD superfamily